MRAALYPLETVWALIPPTSSGLKPKFNVTKSADIVSDALDLTLSDAKDFIYQTIRDLTANDFCETLPLPPPPADLYAVERERRSWYIKFKVLTPPQLEVCGFHPPERPLRTCVGTTIK